MESYKDVIVSEPPAMYGEERNTYGSLVTSLALENYKGILLCDRPIAPSTSSCCNNSLLGDERAGRYHDNVFIPSNPTGNPLGYAPSTEANALHEKHIQMRTDNVRLNRNKNRKILSRHRRWLHSFANQMKTMKAEEQAVLVAATERAARLRSTTLEKAASKRLENSKADGIAVNDKQQLLEEEEEEQEWQKYKYHEESMKAKKDANNEYRQNENDIKFKQYNNNNNNSNTFNNLKQQQQEQQQINEWNAKEKEKAKQNKQTRKVNKPKWAMTEDEALDDEFNVDADLISFAENLDYEKFINDFEVAEALSLMRDRVQQIASERKYTTEDIANAAKSHHRHHRHNKSHANRTKVNEDTKIVANNGNVNINNVNNENENSVTFNMSDDEHNDSDYGEGDVNNVENTLRTVSEANNAKPRKAVHFDGSDEYGYHHARHNTEWNSNTKQLDHNEYEDDTAGNNNSCRGVLRSAISRDAVALAEKLLAASPSMRRIHTRKSLARLLMMCVLKGNVKLNINDLIDISDTLSSKRVNEHTTQLISEPKIVKVAHNALPWDNEGNALCATNDSEGQPQRILCELQHSTERTQGLPYLYRCPAIEKEPFTIQ